MLSPHLQGLVEIKSTKAILHSRSTLTNNVLKTLKLCLYFFIIISLQA